MWVRQQNSGTLGCTLTGGDLPKRWHWTKAVDDAVSRAPQRKRLDLLERGAFYVCAAVLVATVLVTLFWVFGVGSTPYLSQPAALAAVLILGLLVSETGLGAVASALTRAAVSLAAMAWLTWCLFLPRAVRSALTTSSPVETVEDSQLSDYASGVWTLTREFELSLYEAWLPILVLFVASLLPVVRRMSSLGREGDAT